jgi:hypothetical protein
VNLSSTVGLGGSGVFDEGTFQSVELKVLEELHLE